MKKPSGKKWILLNPGPVNVTQRVRRSLLGPDLCHREEEFSRLLRSIRNRLLSIFSIARTHTAVLFTGSGTAAVEAMLGWRRAAGGKTLVLSNGVYGDRLAAILTARGAALSVLRSPIGSFPTLGRIDRALAMDRRLTAVGLVHHETSTGMLNPVREVGRIVKKRGRLLLVDAVSSLGAEELDFRRDGVDFCAGSAAKCLHGFPGVSFVLVPRRETARLARLEAGSVYLDLAASLEAQQRGSVPFTPAVQLFYAFDAALAELEAEGLRSRIARYRALSAQLGRGFRELGLRVLVPEKFRSHVLTALWLPRGVSYARLHDRLKKRGFVIYAGQSRLAGKIFRVANLGDIGKRKLTRFLRALRAALAQAR